jgi:hypothetical protein
VRRLGARGAGGVARRDLAARQATREHLGGHAARLRIFAGESARCADGRAHGDAAEHEQDESAQQPREQERRLDGGRKNADGERREEDREAEAKDGNDVAGQAGA